MRTPSDDERPAWRRYLRFWGSDTRADVRDEIAFHIDGVIEELRASGLSPEDARRAALERFGDAERVARSMSVLAAQRESHRYRRELARGLMGDLAYAARSLLRTPLATTTVIITLAVGLGATTAVFAVLDTLFWRPPSGVARPATVRRVWLSTFERWDGKTHVRPAISYPRYETILGALPPGSRVGLYMADTTARLGREPRAPKVRVSFANAELFATLGVHASIGRLFDSSENVVKSRASVAVVTDRFRKERLAPSRPPIGQTIVLDGNEYTVIGVIDAAFVGVDLSQVDVWAPLGSFQDDIRLRGVAPWWERRGGGQVRAVIRLPRGIDERGLSDRLTERLRIGERGQIRRGGDTTIALAFGPLAGIRGPGETPQEVSIASRLGVLGAILLLIACANVTNLLLARAASRHREVAVRIALGVSRPRLLRLFSAESFLIAIISGIAAGLAAWWAGTGLRALLLPGIAWPGSTLHWRVALFTVGLAFVASWLTSIIPAMQAARTDPSDALKCGGRTQTAGRSPLRFALTAAQLGLSMALLVAASAFVQSLRNVRSLDLGLDVERTVVAGPEYEDRASAPKDEVIAAGLNDIAPRARNIPGVEEVAFSVMRPMTGSWGIFGYFSGQDSLQSIKNADDWAAGFIVSANYFSATRMRFVRGGTFASHAAPGGGGIVVNETMAKLLWPATNPIGQCVHLEKRTNPCSLVVGVVHDARRSKVVEPAKPQYFMSIDDWAPRGWTPSTLVLRISPEQRHRILPALRSELIAKFPTATPLVESIGETLSPQLRPWRLGANLFTIVGVIALVVTIVGVYASIAYHVSQRAREFGVRIAFGATTRDVIRTVLGVGMRPVAVGIAVGIGLALATGRLIAALLYDVSPYSAMTLSMVAILLGGVSVLAMLVPALRASKVDPLSALRAE